MWKIDSRIDVNRVSLEDVKFIFSQAGKRLDDTVKTGESIASKTMSMITVMTGVLIALSGYTISNWKGFSSETDSRQITIIYMSEIENYNNRIDRNLEVNEGRWKKYRISVISFLLLPVILGIVFILEEWLF